MPTKNTKVRKRAPRSNSKWKLHPHAYIHAGLAIGFAEGVRYAEGDNYAKYAKAEPKARTFAETDEWLRAAISQPPRLVTTPMTVNGTHRTFTNDFERARPGGGFMKSFDELASEAIAIVEMATGARPVLSDWSVRKYEFGCSAWERHVVVSTPSVTRAFAVQIARS